MVFCQFFAMLLSALLGSYQLLDVRDGTCGDYPVPAGYQNYWFKVRALFCDGDIRGNCSNAVRAGTATD